MRINCNYLLLEQQNVNVYKIVSAGFFGNALEAIQLPQSYPSLYREYAKQLRPILMIIGMTVFITVLWYLIYVFSVTYMTNMLHYTTHQALGINIFSIMLLVLLEPWVGKLSDYIGRRPLMIFALIGRYYGYGLFSGY